MKPPQHPRHRDAKTRRSGTALSRIPVAARWVLGVCAFMALATALPRAQDPPEASLASADLHRWMDELFERKPLALRLSLARFIFPGSHDSGTYNLLGDAACDGCQSTDLLRDPIAACMEAVPSLAQFCEAGRDIMAGYARDFATAQTLSVRGQLDAGARFLDLRFFRATRDDQTRTRGRLQEGHFYAHHGLAGPDSTIVLDDIATFLNHPSNRREIVILAFSQMKEGGGDMDTATVDAFFDVLRQMIPGKMARKQVASCADDPDCTPTERFGAATTLGEFLGQGSQVIVTCDCTEAPDIWDSMSGATPYMASFLDPDAPEGYPAVDSDYYPWRNDAELFRMANDLSAMRDTHSQEDLFQLGFEIGLDDAGVGMYRWAVCRLINGILTNVPVCGAHNDDWDELKGLDANAGWVNPKVIPAIVGLRRDRVNVLTADHYTSMFTAEVFKLNLGATRVFHVIEQVEQYDDALDDLTDAGPEYYPWFRYLNFNPSALGERLQRYNQIPGMTSISPRWPSWSAFQNATEAADVRLMIVDADPAIAGNNTDDIAAIVENDDASRRGAFAEQIPIKGCVESAGSCLNLTSQQYTDAGNVSDSTKVWFRRMSCVWSWVPGDVGVDPNALCSQQTPEMRIYGTRMLEGNEHTGSFEFVVTLSVPSLYTITAQVVSAPGTAQAGTDYTPTDTVVTFLPGQTRQAIKVFVHGDTTLEADETLSVTLQSPSNATIATGYATGTIVNDDVPTARIEGVSMAEGHSGQSVLTFGVRLDGPSPMPVTLHYRTIDGTAEAGSDYVAVSDGILQMTPGQTTGSATVNVIGDHRIEPDETFAVVLESPTGAVIAQGGAQATGVIVNDDAPATVTTPGPQSGVEGNDDTFALGLLADARPAGPWTVAVKWGDGTNDTYTVASPGALSHKHTYADNGNYTISVSVKDVDGVEAAPVTFAATIANLGPKGTLGNNGPIGEGSQATISFSGPNDPSTVDTAAGFRYAFSCTNASLAAATYANSQASATTSCAFDDNGSRIVRARIIDKDNGFNEYSTTVRVDNVAPTVTAAGVAVYENGVATVTGRVSDPGARDTFVLRVSWGDGRSSQHPLAAGSTAYSVSHQYLDDNPTATPADAMAVLVAVTDKDDGTGSTSTAVIVNNVAPSIGSLSLTDEAGAAPGTALLALTGLPVELHAAFTDVGTLDTHTAAFNWGDGTSGTGQIAQSGGSGTAAGTHTWNAIGNVTLTVSVTDDDTGIATQQAVISVVDGTGAVCGLAGQLTSMLGEAGLHPMVVKQLTQLLGKIDGNVDGRAANGACDMFAKGNWVAALVKLEQAAHVIETLVASGRLTTEQAALLRQVESRLVVAAKWTYVMLQPSASNARKQARAAVQADAAEAATASRDYERAIESWLKAVRLLAPMS